MRNHRDVAAEAIEIIHGLDVEDQVDYLTALMSDVVVAALQELIRAGGECVAMERIVAMQEQECQTHLVEKERRLELVETDD